jgi:hypothetical protein
MNRVSHAEAQRGREKKNSVSENVKIGIIKYFFLNALCGFAQENYFYFRLCQDSAI